LRPGVFIGNFGRRNQTGIFMPLGTPALKRALSLGAVLLFALSLLLILLWRPLQIQYHRGFVNASRTPVVEPTTWRGCLNARWLRWRLDGRPDVVQQMAVGRQHEDALIALNYFGRHTYTFNGQDRQGFVTAVRHGSLKDPLCFFAFGTNRSVEILAHRDDFPTIEKTLEAYQQSKAQWE
jgi:hypothetical protein